MNSFLLRDEFYRWVAVQMGAAITTIRMLLRADVIESYRWIFMYQAALLQQKLLFLDYYNFNQKF